MAARWLRMGRRMPTCRPCPPRTDRAFFPGHRRQSGPGSRRADRPWGRFPPRYASRVTDTRPVLAGYADPGSDGSDNAPVARRHTPLILGADTPRAHAELTDSA